MIDRPDGYDSDIVFECDECGTTDETGESNFANALDYIKEQGWRVTKVAGEWVHFCSIDCYRDGTK